MEQNTIYASTKSEALSMVLNMYHKEDICFQELFDILRFPYLLAGDVISLYGQLSEMIDGDEVFIKKSSGETEKI